jgi:type II secretory pathway component PulF
MSLLISSGLSVVEAITMCGDVLDNPIVQNDLNELSSRVNSGKTFWEGLGEISYVSPLLIGLVKIGEETGRLPETLNKCNLYFEESYRHALRRLNKLFEPIITIILGAILAAIMLAIILPTFELATAI